MGRMAIEGAHEYFLKADLSKYVDEWIAISKNSITAHGKNALEVYKKAEKQGDVRETLFVRVPGRTAMIL